MISHAHAMSIFSAHTNANISTPMWDTTETSIDTTGGPEPGKSFR